MQTEQNRRQHFRTVSGLKLIVILHIVECGTVCSIQGNSTTVLHSESGLGNISLDGTANVREFLIYDERLRSLGIAPELVHHVVFSDSGWVSSWLITCCDSYLALSRPGLYEWMMPIGEKIWFREDRDNLGYDVGGKMRGFYLAHDRNGGLSVSSPDGTSWHYDRGSLTGINSSTGECYSVVATGRRLQRVLMCNGDHRPAIFELERDSGGRVLRLMVDGNCVCSLGWRNDGALETLVNSTGLTTLFSYRCGLLSEIVFPHEQLMYLSWKAIAHARDWGWPVGIYLFEDSYYRYSFELKTRGAKITVIRKADGIETVTTYNPAVRIATQRLSTGAEQQLMIP